MWLKHLFHYGTLDDPFMLCHVQGASPESKEVQRPYHQHWPPDHSQDQHQLQCS